jgi:hypothetical protein
VKSRKKSGEAGKAGCTRIFTSLFCYRPGYQEKYSGILPLRTFHSFFYDGKLRNRYQKEINTNRKRLYKRGVSGCSQEFLPAYMQGMEHNPWRTLSENKEFRNR